MIKKHTITIILVQIISFLSLNANTIVEDIPVTGSTATITFNGYLKTEAFYDNRQIFGSLASQQLVYPLPQQLDPNGNDINNHGEGQFVPFETKVRMIVSGLRAGEADIMGLIEGDFEGKEDSGTSDIYFNLFRMRHAYMLLDWEYLSLLFGQTWHPTTIPEVSPNCVSFNSGRPIEQYTRAPQCMIAYNFYPEHQTFVTGWKTMNPVYYTRQLRLSLTVSSEVDFTSDGPNGLSSQYMRFAIIPNIHLQLKGYWNENVAGFGFDYKRLNPRLESDQGYRVREHINSVAALWFLAINRPKYHINCKLTLGQNMSDRDTIGGYAVVAGSINPITGAQKYTNISALTFWTDIVISRFRRAEPAVFVGFAKNLGPAKNIIPNSSNPNAEPTVFGLGTNARSIIRISPRLRMKIKSLVFAAEYEYTRAAFGTLTAQGNIIDVHPVANNRLLLAAFYYF